MIVGARLGKSKIRRAGCQEEHTETSWIGAHMESGGNFHSSAVKAIQLIGSVPRRLSR